MADETEQKTEAKEKTIELRCIYGNKIKLQDLKTNDITEYTLVPAVEENLRENMISNYTDVGKAVWAKKEGDEVEIEINGNLPRRFKIIEIDNV